jgi:predicted dehydrogenase
VADQHVAAISRVPNCQIVAVCDHEILMARQLGERCGVVQCFSDLSDMFQSASPNVVHITTPPQSHFSLARQCLESGSHVYLEKPFAITARETESLLNLADKRGLKMTAGHNYQFTLEMLEMRRLVGEGFLGGKPLHLESYWSYDLGDISYAGPVLGNRNHWVRQLPGQLFHNIISHGIAKLSEFLDENLTEVVASAYQSAKIKSLGGGEGLMDELRVLLRDKTGTTAYFWFSTQVGGLNQLRIYGPASSMISDIVTGSLTRRDHRPYKSYLTYFIPPVKNAREHLRNARLNLMNFLRRKLYQDFGMSELVARFYDSIRSGGPVPIPYREILLTAQIMDEIFAQIYPTRQPSATESSIAVSDLPLSLPARIA